MDIACSVWLAELQIAPTFYNKNLNNDLFLHDIFTLRFKLISMGFYTGHSYKYGGQWQQLIYVGVQNSIKKRKHKKILLQLYLF